MLYGIKQVLCIIVQHNMRPQRVSGVSSQKTQFNKQLNNQFMP